MPYTADVLDELRERIAPEDVTLNVAKMRR
jgi:hypothetical protein